jgi:hypothetical protein
MKTILWSVTFWLGLAGGVQSATTINAVNRFAYGANLGWINWQGDVANGAVIGAFVCLLPPSAGSTTTRNVPASADPYRFFLVEAIKPLSP